MDVVYLQRDFGILGAVRYPLDRFRRFELELSAGGVERYCPMVPFLNEGYLEYRSCQWGDAPLSGGYSGPADWRARNGGVNFTLAPTIRFGYDTIRYSYATGPLAGRSLLLEVGGGFLPGLGAVHGFAHFDAQQYFQLVGRANIGFRFSGATSGAPDAVGRVWQKTWWLSAADNLRGFYPYDDEDLLGRHYWVANAELQIPLDPILRLFIFESMEGIAALDFGGVFNQFHTTPARPELGDCRTTTEEPLECIEPGAWDSRTLTGVLGVNVLFGPLLLRLHFGHPFDIGGLRTQALRTGADWVTNITLRYFFW
jgi:hypothetical protein